MKRLIDQLRDNHQLSPDGYWTLLTMHHPDDVEYLMLQAREVAQRQFGKSIYLRGLIELTNVCRNDCLYCGIRRGNTHVTRYTLTREQVIESCAQGYRIGFRTFVLQGGEWGEERSAWIAEIISEIRQRWRDCGAMPELTATCCDTRLTTNVITASCIPKA